MREAIVTFLQQYGISSEIIIFVISMCPVLELRLGLITASALGVPLIKAFIICFIGNIIPVPFILLFINAIFTFCKKHNILTGIINKLESKTMKKGDSVKTKRFLGLFIFVAVPLPGTGAWTGSLIASLLEMPIKKSFYSIAAGVFTAGIIMIVISYFIPSLFGF